MHDLNAFTAADQFKSYDDLKKRLNYVLGQKPARRVDEEVFEEDNSRGSFQPNFETRKAEETVTAAVASATATSATAVTSVRRLRS